MTMNKLILTLVFFSAFVTKIYFLGKIITWHAYKINPKNFSKHISSDNITWYNFVMLLSIILWSILFYYSK